MRALRTLFAFQDMLIITGVCYGYNFDRAIAVVFGLLYLIVVIARECMVHDINAGN